MLTKTHSAPQIDLKEKKYSLREAFGRELPADQFIMGYEPSGCPFVPSPVKVWKWDVDLLRMLTTWWEYGTVGEGLHTFGPPGAGKSGSLQQFCAALQIPLYEKTIVQNIEFDDLVVKVNLAGGCTVPSYSWLPLAMGAEGFPGVFCASEIDRGDPAILIGLNEVLDGRPLLMSTMELESLRPHPRFRIATNGNTAMAGDSTGLYVSARQQDYAFQDRFWIIPVRYLPPEVEEELLAEEVPGVKPDIRTKMIQCANELRNAFLGNFNGAPSSSVPAPQGQPQLDRGRLPMTMTTRTLVRWAHGIVRFERLRERGISPVYYALDRAFLNRAIDRPALYQALNTIVTGVLGERTSQATP